MKDNNKDNNELTNKECDKKSNYNRRSRSNTKSRQKKSDKPKNLGKTVGDDINNPTYYYSDNELLNQITNFSFNQFAGVPFDIGTITTGNTGKLKVGIPTIMSIKLNPSAGMASLRQGLLEDEVKVTDGVFKAGLKNYYMLSAGNAKTTNYQPQDVTMLIFALTSVMELISFTQRILGTPFIFNVRNRDLPKQLIESQGITYDDLVRNMADYRIRFNTLIQMLNKIPIPSNVKAFMKSSSMYSNYYTDDTSPMAQFYVMSPDYLWKFDETTEPGRLNTVLVTSPTVGTHTALSNVLNTLENMINSILTSATFNFIFADILRLAEKGQMHILNYGLIPDGYVAPILYSHEFNLWIDNAVVLGNPVGTSGEGYTAGNSVEQYIDQNTLKYSPIFTYNTENHMLTNYTVNFDTNNPSVEDKVAATRLLAGYYTFGTDAVKAVCSTHYITSITVKNDESYFSIMPFNIEGFDSTKVAGWYKYQLRRLDILAKFKHAPHVHIYDKDITTEDQYVIDSGDYDYYTTVDIDYLRRMFDAEWLTYLCIE